MSNQTKLLTSILFIVAIILCLGLTRFYLDVTKNTDQVQEDANIASIVRTCENGMSVFEDKNGFHGVLDQSGAVIVDPEWMEVLYVTEKVILVSKRMNNVVLIGGIDYEENVVLPFMFSSVKECGPYYVGTIAEDNSCVIYNSVFTPVFTNTWEDAEYINHLLVLTKEGNQFSYYVEEDLPVLRKAQMHCHISDLTLDWNVANKVYLSSLQPTDFLRINTGVSAYLEMLMTNQFSGLPQISSSEYIDGLSKANVFQNVTFDEIRDFSFSSAMGEKQIYDFAFTIRYHTPQTAEQFLEQTVHMHLYFKRNTDQQLVLTSADLDFHNTEIPVTEAPTPDAE